jgi:hypothetical protein
LYFTTKITMLIFSIVTAYYYILILANSFITGLLSMPTNLIANETTDSFAPSVVNIAASDTNITFVPNNAFCSSEYRYKK